jgi:hypothetical protein
VRQGEEGLFKTLLKVEGHIIEFRIDTGADVTVINRETARKLGKPFEGVGKSRIFDAGGRELRKEGIVNALVEYKGKCIPCRMIVVSSAPKNLLGIPEILRLGLLQSRRHRNKNRLSRTL